MMRRFLGLLLLIGGCVLLSGSLPKPSRCERAKGNLETFRMYLDWFKSTRGYYPETLEDLCAVVGTSSCKLFDPWGHKYQYERRFNGVEFYSWGTDGIPGTQDDIYPGVPTRWSNCLWTPREMEAVEKFLESGPGRCTIANKTVRQLRSVIDSYQRIHGKYPTVLKDICVDITNTKDHIGRPLSLIDPYGQPYSYVSDALGFELYSNGPDGQPQTPDDIHGWYDLTRCTEEPHKHPEMLGKDRVDIYEDTFEVNLFTFEPTTDLDEDDEQSSELAMPRSCGCSFVGA